MNLQKAGRNPKNSYSLLEVARRLDELELTLYVKEFVMCYYTDGTQEYKYSPVVQGEPVTFTLHFQPLLASYMILQSAVCICRIALISC